MKYSILYYIQYRKNKDGDNIIIHVVKEGDSLYKIGQLYNVDYRKIAYDNDIQIDKKLVVGQTIVIITNNFNKNRQITINGFAFPNIDKRVLLKALPSLTYLGIFSYQVNANGDLNTIDDNDLITMAKNYKVLPMMVVTNIGTEDRFDSDLAHTILINDNVQNRLIDNILKIMDNKIYEGVDIDFEYVYPQDKDAYLEFLNKVNLKIKERGYFLMVAVAPKTSNEQQGLLYEAHDYKKIGEIADYVIIMTYEWGYSGGPSMAVAPIDLVMKVIDYATKKIPSNKILMGLPNYGYDWQLPFVKGEIAKSISNYEAVEIARSNNQAISFNDEDQAPFFNYYDTNIKQHEVWFEDARSIQAKLALIMKYYLEGISIWTIDRPFPQLYLILNTSFDIKKY